ncbi:endonuclease/exonuclease/phosphatase family protein [Altericroceibacterium xinjiangense]|uniref:endonuclease/exonuclease/phosphatase family protein n=1 Tax=Altericroceibacterium xinjiangense TaxID=762261 RepID=UPI000F7F1E07|nr:endonuclease/exonuclease/phosphatase family protein [Altericroceibacterium xinjiangense]
MRLKPWQTTWRRLAWTSAAAFLLTGCVTLPEARSVSCSRSAEPQVRVSEDGHTASVEIDVLTYNVEGLGWPARTGRGRHLQAISDHLAELHGRGEAPDIVLFQEVFSRSAARAIGASSYPSLVAGPERNQRRPRRDYSGLPGKRRPERGEIGFRVFSSGLVTVSTFPIVASRSEPFPRASCAGFDCLANKGMLLAEVAIPGVPGTLAVLNTHMNAQRASRVSVRRHNAAHARQVHALSRFLDSGISDQPAVLGGDFNMRSSEQRFEVFRTEQSLEIVHQYCTDHASLCEVELSWDGDAPWMDTQDLQLFSSGGAVTVRPIRVEAMFDGASEPKLSDHDGLRVTYELSWRTDTVVPPPPCSG